MIEDNGRGRQLEPKIADDGLKSASPGSVGEESHGKDARLNFPEKKRTKPVEHGGVKKI